MQKSFHCVTAIFFFSFCCLIRLILRNDTAETRGSHFYGWWARRVFQNCRQCLPSTASFDVEGRFYMDQGETKRSCFCPGIPQCPHQEPCLDSESPVSQGPHFQSTLIQRCLCFAWGCSRLGAGTLDTTVRIVLMVWHSHAPGAFALLKKMSGNCH